MRSAPTSASPSHTSGRRHTAPYQLRPLVEFRPRIHGTGHAAEQVAVEAFDQLGESRAARLVEAHFPRVFGGGLRWVKLHGASALEREHERHVAVPERLRITTGDAVTMGFA